LAVRSFTIHRARAAPVLVGTIVLIGLGIAAAPWASSGQATTPRSQVDADAAAATSIGVARQATTLVDSDLPLGLLLGLEAHHIWPTPEAFRAVVRGLERAEQKPLMATTDWGIASLAVADRGRTLAALSFDPRWSLAREKVGEAREKVGEGLPARPGIIKLWDTSRMALVPAATIGAGELVSSLAFRRDAKLLAAGSASSPIVKVWTAGDEATPSLRDLGETMVTAVAFDPSGRVLASGSQHGIIRLSRERRPMRYALERTLRHRHNGAVTSLAFSPRRSDVLGSAGADKAVALWHLDRDRAPMFLDGGDAMSTLAFSPDGQVVATASLDAMLRLWNASTGERLKEIPTPAGLSAVAFRPDNKSLAVGGADGTVRFYRRGRDWKQVIPGSVGIGAGRDRITSIQFSRDGRALVVGTESQLVLLDAGLESWASKACRVARRELTNEERARFLPGLPSGPPRCAQRKD
jgi:WD domain, G-beta repeat